MSFPTRITQLPPFDGPFGAYRLAAELERLVQLRCPSRLPAISLHSTGPPSAMKVKCRQAYNIEANLGKQYRRRK